jgi:D-alanyl-D-alanine carboxypeptidase
MTEQSYRERIAELHASMGIGPDYAASFRLPLQPEASQLTPIGRDIHDRRQQLAPPAAEAWFRMRDAALGHGIDLLVVSAYRSVGYQENLLRAKLDRGQSLDEILRVSAAPGYSEHHSGRALDLTTPGYAPLEEEFENSPAFEWLSRNAGAYGFHLSYPRDNAHGVIYEPWHWAWREPA